MRRENLDGRYGAYPLHTPFLRFRPDSRAITINKESPFEGIFNSNIAVRERLVKLFGVASSNSKVLILITLFEGYTILLQRGGVEEELFSRDFFSRTDNNSDSKQPLSF